MCDVTSPNLPQELISDPGRWVLPKVFLLSAAASEPQGASGNVLHSPDSEGLRSLVCGCCCEGCSTCHCRTSGGDTEEFHQAPQITRLGGNMWEVLLCDFSHPVDKEGKRVGKSLGSEPYQFKINFLSFINLFWKSFPIWKLPRS